MAEVFLGLDVLLGRAVAVKQLAARYSDDLEVVALFEAEARQIAKLNHPGVVQIFDAGDDRDARAGSGRPFIVMELINGTSLRALLRERDRMTPSGALRIAAELLDALAHCHDAGVVHGDVKPANVMVTFDGAVKLIDFGLARSLPNGAVDEAVAGQFGTARYSSPEQVRKDVVDARSDIYSTGCVLYHLLAGRPPFVGETYSDIAAQHMFVPPPAVSRWRPELGPAWDELLERCLVKDPGDRFGSAHELKAAIGALRSSPVVRSGSSRVGPAERRSVADRRGRRGRRGRGLGARWAAAAGSDRGPPSSRQLSAAS
jgi:serine/threonine-protein kinase